MSREDIVDLYDLAYVENLPDMEREILTDLIDLWDAKLSRNQLRVQYYECKNKLKDLGIAIPPPLKNVETVVGWAAAAVDVLAARSKFDSFTYSGEENEQLSKIFGMNRFKLMYHQAVTSELIHSCSFITVSKGGRHEPEIVLNAYSALNAAAMWDDRGQRIKYGMTVVEIKRKPYETPQPTWVNLYTDEAVWEIRRDDGGTWHAECAPHNMERPLMEALVYSPTLDRPFGKSRISRAVMSTVDSAVRTALRSEVTSEFFTAPQKYLLGADDSVFESMSKWEAYIGNIIAFSENGETGEKPTFGQLSQGSMQPHSDYMRTLAAKFSGETHIPISELGVIHDNPSSADSIYAQKEPLIIDAEWLNETNGAALKSIAQMILAYTRDTSYWDVADEAYYINPRFKNPAMPSIASSADGMCKIVGAIPKVGTSDVALEYVGFDNEEIKRINHDNAKAEAQQALQAAMQSTQEAKPTQTQLEL